MKCLVGNDVLSFATAKRPLMLSREFLKVFSLTYYLLVSGIQPHFFRGGDSSE